MPDACPRRRILWQMVTHRYSVDVPSLIVLRYQIDCEINLEATLPVGRHQNLCLEVQKYLDSTCRIRMYLPNCQSSYGRRTTQVMTYVVQDLSVLPNPLVVEDYQCRQSRGIAQDRRQRLDHSQADSSTPQQYQQKWVSLEVQ